MEFEELKSIAIYGTVGSLADGEVVYRKLSPPDGTFMKAPVPSIAYKVMESSGVMSSEFLEKLMEDIAIPLCSMPKIGVTQIERLIGIGAVAFVAMREECRSVYKQYFEAINEGLRLAPLVVLLCWGCGSSYGDTGRIMKAIDETQRDRALIFGCDRFELTLTQKLFLVNALVEHNLFELSLAELGSYHRKCKGVADALVKERSIEVK